MGVCVRVSVCARVHAHKCVCVCACSVCALAWERETETERIMNVKVTMMKMIVNLFFFVSFYSTVRKSTVWRVSAGCASTRRRSRRTSTFATSSSIWPRTTSTRWRAGVSWLLRVAPHAGRSASPTRSAAITTTARATPRTTWATPCSTRCTAGSSGGTRPSSCRGSLPREEVCRENLEEVVEEAVVAQED